jgi:hypothetical protein
VRLLGLKYSLRLSSLYERLLQYRHVVVPLDTEVEPTEPWRQPSVSAIDPSIHFSLRVEGSTFARAILSQGEHW